MAPLSNVEAGWDASLSARRARLVCLCAYLTRDPDSADDLAQETLIEAWRHREKLRDPLGTDRWLAAIARHVCRRWTQRHGHERAYRTSVSSETDEVANAAHSLGAEPDVAIELEREDLARLLDRAMALLPPETRDALVRRYVEEMPQAEIARHLRTSEGAVEARLQRGKLTLRRVLTTTLRAEAAAAGIIRPAATWLTTRMWCPICGQRRLEGRFEDEHTSFELRCPACCVSPTALIASACLPDLFRDVIGFNAAYARLLARLGADVGLDGRPPSCAACGSPARLDRHAGPFAGWALPSFRQRCPRCDWRWDFTMTGFLLALPAGRQFWRRHPPIRSLPVREVEASGAPALVGTFEDVAGSARLDVVCDRETLRVVSLNG